MLISLDTETTGVDFAHGAMPFFVTTCDDQCAPNSVKFWEWNVDPLTRRVDVPPEDVAAIQALLDSADRIYMQNSKFDCRALLKIGVVLPWPKVRDTLVAAHLLGSNLKKDLTSLADRYLYEQINKYEDKVEQVTKQVRTIVKRHYPHWRYAREGEGDMPSVKSSTKRQEDKPWKNDMWLTRALYRHDPSKIPHGEHEEWLDACPNYANADSSITLPLGLEMEKQIRDRGYWAHYEHRLHLMRIAVEMEEYGVTALGDYTEANIDSYARYCAEVGDELSAIADEFGHELELAKGAALNDNMRDFFYGYEHLLCPRCGYDKRVKHWNGESAHQFGPNCPQCAKGNTRKASVTQPMQLRRRPNLQLGPIEGKKSGNASLDADAMQEYLSVLEDGPALEFIKLLKDKRKRDTDLMYMRAYQRFWVPVVALDGTVVPGYFRIHPSLNPFSTAHLRWTSNSPNLQNVGGKEDKCEECEGEGGSCPTCNGTGKSRMSVKHCFGPAPGREWYTMDYRSIEGRLPPYACGEEKQIEVYEKPDQPPYWGNMYLLTASVLYPDEFWPLANNPPELPGGFRKEYPKLYKKAKFFVLAKNYGAGRRKGDLLSGIKNSYDLVNSEFPKLTAYQAEILAIANRTGWVHTMPTRAIDPTRGYPLLASRTEDNYVLSTTPFNYHISGTACESKNLAEIRCSAQLAQWRLEGFDGYMALDIHDEIMFDFPRGPTTESNRWRAEILRDLMEQSGKDLIPSIPLPVGVEYHDHNWAEGVKV